MTFLGGGEGQLQVKRQGQKRNTGILRYAQDDDERLATTTATATTKAAATTKGTTTTKSYDNDKSISNGKSNSNGNDKSNSRSSRFAEG
jgi:hypothetical protein